MSDSLSISAAAKRVHRHRRTLERWIADGDLDVMVVRDGDGRVTRRYVKTAHLLEVYRGKLASDKGGKGNPRLGRYLTNDDTPR